MKLLLTGNLGYLGPVVCNHLRQSIPGIEITGFDAGYFDQCKTVAKLSWEEGPDFQIYGDVREFPAAALKGKDAVLHLAAISNDPMGKLFERVTREVNFESTVQIARLARAQGVRHFVFASSCSVYGIDDGSLKTENSEVHPLTAYAQSKIESERQLAELAGPSFNVTALRFATACGFSARCRLDLVLNDFVASALSKGEITLLSDGTPWRPLIHVADMARAMEWALTRGSENGGAFLSLNVGSENWNYRIGDLARAVAAHCGNVPVSMNSQAGPDKRSYRVDFSEFRRLAPSHQPRWTLEQAVGELAQGLGQVITKGQDFRNSAWVRLAVLADLVASSKVDADLRWAQTPN